MLSFMIASATTFAHGGEATQDAHDETQCVFCLLAERDDNESHDSERDTLSNNDNKNIDPFNISTDYHLLSNSSLVLKIAEDAYFLFSHSLATHHYDGGAISARAPPLSL